MWSSAYLTPVRKLQFCIRAQINFILCRNTKKKGPELGTAACLFAFRHIKGQIENKTVSVHIMKAHEGVNVWLHLFLTSALNGREERSPRHYLNRR